MWAYENLLDTSEETSTSWKIVFNTMKNQVWRMHNESLFNEEQPDARSLSEGSNMMVEAFILSGSTFAYGRFIIRLVQGR